jgi:hypothetical protein
MDVFMVPLPRDRYDLYCEVEGRAPATGMEETAGWRARAARSFREVIDYIEQDLERRRAVELALVSRTRWQRLRDCTVGWMAERIAEQRLLWHLRSVDAATLRFPEDLRSAHALDRVRATLKQDARRHLRWAVIDALGYLVSLPLTIIPGPNLVAYYFVFRAGGHLFSWMGARHGLTHVEWKLEPSGPLAELRHAVALGGAEAHSLVRSVAQRLELKRLEAFVERTLAAAA